MKSLKILLFAAVATILAACTKDDGFSNASYESVKALEPVPVAFGTYMGDAATTRAGYVGNIPDVATLVDDAVEFGVFAYYTGNNFYPGTKEVGAGDIAAVFSTDHLFANFMYNQKIEGVELSTTPSVTYSWSYSPVKYWPNETTSDNNGATSNRKDKVSFFAYAPYVAVTQVTTNAKDGANATETGTSGITKLSGNAFEGNPTVTYVLDNNGKNVDLLWGTAGATDPDVLGTAQPAGTGIVQYGTGFDGNAKVNINLTKQKVAGSTTDPGQIKFDFRHALAQLGGKANAGLLIQTDEDVAGNIGAETRVTVKSITIATQDTKDMPKQGTFDLATGVWNSVTPSPSDNTTYLELTHIINNDESNNAAANTWRLNSSIIEPKTVGYWTGKADNGAWVLGVPTGVTFTATDVYHSTAEPNPIVFIPGTTPKLKITVDYFVRTADKNLKDGYSVVEQEISKNVSFTNPVEANKQYKLLLKLGMTTVKVSATVAPWTQVTAGSESTPTSVDLPLNVN